MHQFPKEVKWLTQGELSQIEAAYSAILWEELAETL